MNFEQTYQEEKKQTQEQKTLNGSLEVLQVMSDQLMELTAQCQNLETIVTQILSSGSEKTLEADRKEQKEFLYKTISEMLEKNKAELQNVQDKMEEVGMSLKEDLETKSKSLTEESVRTFQKNVDELLDKVESHIDTSLSSIGIAESKLDSYLSNYEKICERDYKNQFKLVMNMIAVVIVVFILGVGGLWFAQSYGNGKRVAEIALANVKEKIEVEAVERYKSSAKFTEDSCKYVAKNISKVKVGYLLYKYIDGMDLQKYPDLNVFYRKYLSEGNKLYKETNKGK